MGTLTVAATTDYRTPPNSTLVTGQDIVLVNFTNASQAVIDFNDTQFGFPNVSNAVTFDGNASGNQIRVHMTAPGAFSALDWSFLDWGVGGDTVFIDGSSGNDTIFGSGQADRLWGGTGSDSMSGDEGTDGFDYFAANELVSGEILNGGGGIDGINLNNVGTYRFYDATLTSVEALRFLFGGGAALFSSSQLGAGGPVNLVSGAAAPGTIETIGVFGQTIDVSGVSFATWSPAEGDRVFLVGTYEAGTITGTGQADVLLGGNGADSLTGGAGNDSLVGDNGGGSISLGGGALAQPGNGANVSTATATNLNSLFSLGSNANIDASTTIPHVTITSGARTAPKIEFFSLDLAFAGTVITVDIDSTGGSLDSFVEIRNASGQVIAGNDDTASADPGSATSIDSRVSVGIATPGLYYVVIGSSVAGSIGNLAAGHTYQAHVSVDGEINGTGNDTLDGGPGVDTMVGSTGNDTYTIDNLLDVMTENASEGTDTVRTQFSNYTLPTNFENLIGTAATPQSLTGNSVANAITGSIANDTLTGGDSNDTLDGGGGTDSLVGGIGNDTYYVDTFTDVIVEAAGAGTELVFSANSYIFHANVENVSLTGTGGFGVIGNELANIIIGNAGANGITGGLGNDTIDSGSGGDTMNGEGGNDSMSGGTGADVYFVDSVGDTVTEVVEAGVFDTIWTLVTLTLPTEAEILILDGGLAINGTGNDGAADNNPNLMLGNNAANTLTTFGGDDIILGRDGNDTINSGAGSAAGVEIISGGVGSDTLTSGGGHDFFTYENILEGGDTITDFTTAGGNDLDILDLRPMFFPTFTNLGGVTNVAQAVASGHLTFTQAGANTQVFADANGGVHNPGEQVLLATINNTTAAAVQVVTLI